MAATTLTAARLGLLEDMQLPYFASTTTGAGAADGTTLVDTALQDQPNAHYVDWWFFNPATPAGRRAIAHTTSTVTFGRAFAAQVATSTAYVAYRHFSPDEVKGALNGALRDTDLWPILYKPVIDNTITLVADTYSYSKPSTITGVIQKVEMEDDTSNATKPYTEISVRQWKEVVSNLTHTIQFTTSAGLIAGRKLKVYGQGVFASWGSEASTVDIEAPLLGILYAAAALRLCNGKALAGPTAAEFWVAKAKFWADQLQSRMEKIQQPREALEIASPRYYSNEAEW